VNRAAAATASFWLSRWRGAQTSEERLDHAFQRLLGLARTGSHGERMDDAAVFLASDKASSMTGTTVNLTMGSLDD
jgi:hypothetical protein